MTWFKVPQCIGNSTQLPALINKRRLTQGPQLWSYYMRYQQTESAKSVSSITLNITLSIILGIDLTTALNLTLPVYQPIVCCQHCCAFPITLLSGELHSQEYPAQRRGPHFSSQAFHAGRLGALTLWSLSVSVRDYKKKWKSTSEWQCADSSSRETCSVGDIPHVCNQSHSQKAAGLTHCLLPYAQSILTNAADCKPWPFVSAMEGPGVVLFLGVFKSPFQAVKLASAEEWKVHNVALHFSNVLLLPRQNPSLIL